MRAVKEPAVRQLQRQPRVVRGLHLHEVRHEIRAEGQAQRLDLPRLLGPATGQLQHRELFLGPEHHQIRSESNARLLALVVVQLHDAVVWHVVRHYTRRVARRYGADFVVAGQGLQLLQHQRRQRLLPQLLVRRQHVCLAHHRPHGAALHVPDVDPLVLVQGDGIPPLHNGQVYAWDILLRAINHPAVAWAAVHLVAVGVDVHKSLGRSQQQRLVRLQHEDVTDTRLQALARAQEELCAAPSQLPLPQQVPTVAPGVHHDAKLAGPQDRQVHVSYELLVRAQQVRLRHGSGHKPLLSGRAARPKHVHKAAHGLDANRPRRS
mmetsp:Transcript_89341/g.149144  ORF Transcript_89341/g.149144 Transcript_89341/m.149144 type:complete len:321 (-) Transcript_89341:746-1708(-)